MAEHEWKEGDEVWMVETILEVCYNGKFLKMDADGVRVIAGGGRTVPAWMCYPSKESAIEAVKKVRNPTP